MSSKIFSSSNWERLVSPQRKKQMDPQAFFKISDPGTNEIWADIGCGPGYFTFPLAGRVQKVFATDISVDMLEICRSRARDENLSNIEFVQSDSTEINIPSNSVEGILLVNVFHEFSAADKIIRELGRILKPGGRVYNIDWRYAAMEVGPPLAHRLPEEQVERNFASAGFLFAEQHDIYEQNYVLEFIHSDR